MQEIENLAILLIQGDTDKVWDFIQTSKISSRIEIYENLLTPAMKHIGFLWESNKIS